METYQSDLGTAVVALLVLAVVWFVGRRLVSGGKHQQHTPAAAGK